MRRPRKVRPTEDLGTGVIAQFDWIDIAALGALAFATLRLIESIAAVGAADTVFRTGASRAALLVILLALLGAAAFALLDGSEAGRRIVGRLEGHHVIVTAAAAAPALAVVFTGLDLGSADSAVLLSTNAFLRANGLDLLLTSQEAALPHVVYAPLVALGWPSDWLVLVPALTTFLLALAVGLVIGRLTSLPTAALGVLVLLGLPPVLFQSARLPLYPVFTLAGWIGIVGIVKAIQGDGRLWAPLGGVGVAVAVATHGAGLYFGPLAIATVILASDRARLRRWFASMVWLGLANLPWLISHLWVGGLTRLSTPRDAWFLTNGHQLSVNRDYWELPVASRLDTLFNMPGLFSAATGVLTLPLLAFGIYGCWKLPVRWRWFSFAGLMILWTPLVLSRSASFIRYYYPVLPAVVVLAAIGYDGITTRSATLLRRLGALLAVLTIGGQMGTSLESSIRSRSAAEPRTVELRAAADVVGDGRAVIGARSFLLNLAEPDLPTLHHDLLEEEDFVALYGWDAEALALLVDEHSIGWVMLYEPVEEWEVRYQDSWLDDLGVSARHADVLSDAGCQVFDGEYLDLYDLPACLAAGSS